MTNTNLTEIAKLLTEEMNRNIPDEPHLSQVALLALAVLGESLDDLHTIAESLRTLADNSNAQFAQSPR